MKYYTYYLDDVPYEGVSWDDEDHDREVAALQAELDRERTVNAQLRRQLSHVEALLELARMRSDYVPDDIPATDMLLEVD